MATNQISIGKQLAMCTLSVAMESAEKEEKESAEDIRKCKLASNSGKALRIDDKV